MRLLVVDRCPLMTWVMQHLAPPEVEVERAATLEQAREILRHRPPHAAVFTVSPHSLPLSDFERMCRDHRPPIPTAYNSFVYRSREDAGLPADTQRFFTVPSSNLELREQIERLVAVVDRGRRESRKGAAAAQVT